MARAQTIILHGHQLAACHHYAMALIVQRCNELRHRCDTLSKALRAKHTHLSQAHQLLLRLDQVKDTHIHTFIYTNTHTITHTNKRFATPTFDLSI